MPDRDGIDQLRWINYKGQQRERQRNLRNKRGHDETQLGPDILSRARETQAEPRRRLTGPGEQQQGQGYDRDHRQIIKDAEDEVCGRVPGDADRKAGNVHRAGYMLRQQHDGSPAVGGFLANGATGIAVGTGTYYLGATDTHAVKAFTTRLGLVWSDTLDGPTSSSPALADAQVPLHWVAPTGAGAATLTGYNVYVGTAPGHEAGTPVNGATPITGTNYVVSGLTNGQGYDFEVKAITSAGEGAPSPEASASPVLASGPPAPPVVPPILVPARSPTTTTTATTTTTLAATTTTGPPPSPPRASVPQIIILSSRAKVVMGDLPVKLSCQVATCSGTVTVILVRKHKAVVLAVAPYRSLGVGRTDVLQLAVTGAGSARFSGRKTVEDRCVASVNGGLAAIKMLRIS